MAHHRRERQYCGRLAGGAAGCVNYKLLRDGASADPKVNPPNRAKIGCGDKLPV